MKVTMQLRQDDSGDYVATFTIPREAMTERPVREVLTEYLNGQKDASAELAENRDLVTMVTKGRLDAERSLADALAVGLAELLQNGDPRKADAAMARYREERR